MNEITLKSAFQKRAEYEKRVKTDENLSIKELIFFIHANGFSHQEFADTMGVTIQGVYLWLNGKRDISLTTTRVIRLLTKYPQLIREFK